jgi:hypothetical protein
MLLLSGAGAILLANAVIGDGREERNGSSILRYAALGLVLCVLPLAVLAGASMGQRIGQYGWTPERIWGVIAVGVAIAYGLLGWWAAYRGRRDFDDPLRPLQTKLAIGLCGLALFLALPILDFGSISARSQIARLESGEVKAEEFDWAAMAFDFGPEGRERLVEIQNSGPAAQRALAKAALESDSRYAVSERSESIAEQSRLDQYLRVMSPDIVMTPELRSAVTTGYDSCNDRPCVLARIDANRLLLVTTGYDKAVQSRIIEVNKLGSGKERASAIAVPPPVKGVDLARAQIEIRPAERRQLYVEGKPVGEPFE